MTTNDIIASARRKILETGDDLVSGSVLLEYANSEYREVRKKLKMSSDVIVADIVCSNGVCTLPSDYGAMYSTAIDPANNHYEEVSLADFYNDANDYYFSIEEGAMKVSKDDITSITIRYYPAAVTLSSSQNPDIDDLFHEVIVYGVISRAQEDLQDEELATFYRSKADSEFKRKAEIQSSYEEGNQKGGQLFKEQQLIS